MFYKIATRYEALTLAIKVSTDKPEKIRVILKDSILPNTVFTDRYSTIYGTETFFIKIPVSGSQAILCIFNERTGNIPDLSDHTFQVLSIEKMPLGSKPWAYEFLNPDVHSFIKFCTRFCFNAGWIKSGNYKSGGGKFLIEYVPTIISAKDGKEMNTPARISLTTHRIQVSQRKMVPLSIPRRMAIMLHEFSHVYLNNDSSNESEADINGLRIYLGLGYPRVEGLLAFSETFEGTPTKMNGDRYRKINDFVEKFEKNPL